MNILQEWNHNGDDLETIIDKYGPWSAMSIRLGDGEYTKETNDDFRLKRFVQIVQDTTSKPLNECRILDLACLEGHYGIEFALQGAAEVVCVEIREANLVKTAYAADKLNLTNFKLYQDDVRNLSPEKYGLFDIIICSGILYHLTAIDAHSLIQQMYLSCSSICIIDTYIALRRDNQVSIDGNDYSGMFYTEHDESAQKEEKKKDLWASIDNSSSFWFTHASLTTIISQAGFTSCSVVCLPTHPELTFDRRTYLLWKGKPVQILSSELTDRQDHVDIGHEDVKAMHAHQIQHGVIFKMAKTFFPQSLKNMIKPTLRRIGILKTQEAPDFVKNNEEK